jgi:hypothetical protein
MADEPATKAAAKPEAAATQAAQDAAWEEAQSTGDADWVEQMRATEAEYGTWVATTTIPIKGVSAFHVGHSVPISHVDTYGLDRRMGPDGNPIVAKRGTKAADAALKALGG